MAEMEDQILDILKSKGKSVFYSVTSHVGVGSISNIGSELPSVNYEVIEGPVQIYKHTPFKTKNYHDWTCAAFKLYRFCESLPKTDKMFIRRSPVILKMNDLEKQRTLWAGFVRFSNKPENN